MERCMKWLALVSLCAMTVIIGTIAGLRAAPCQGGFKCDSWACSGSQTATNTGDPSVNPGACNCVFDTTSGDTVAKCVATGTSCCTSYNILNVCYGQCATIGGPVVTCTTNFPFCK